MPLYPPPVIGMRRVERGSLTAVTAVLDYSVVFATSMPDDVYDVAFTVSGLAVAVSSVARTPEGFTMRFTIGVNGLVRWVAVAQ